MRPFDTSGEFRPTAGGEELRRAAVRGVGVSIFASGMSFVLQFIGTIVLARLLAPSDFGVVTMVTTFSLLVCSFGLNGFTEAILQRDGVTHSLASNLFWINFGAGVVLTAAFAALGSLLAWFYHDPLVKRVTEGMSLTILAGSFSVIHLALANRALRFAAVSANNVVARSISVIVSIILAFEGWGYWALVVGYLTQQVSTSVGAWIICRWTPGIIRRGVGTGEAMKFALKVYSHFGFSYATGNTDNLIVGSRFHAQALGFYKKAFDLFYLPLSQLMSPIGAVVIATLSRFNHDRASYQRYFLAGISFLAFVGMGIGADFTLVGRDMIRFLLGPGWEEAGRIFVFFGPGIGIMMLYNTHGWIHLSVGRPGRWLVWAVIEFLSTVSLFMVALRWGPRGIAGAWTVSFTILLIPAFWYAGKPIGLEIAAVLGAVWKYFAASVVAGFATAWVIRSVPMFGTMPGALGALARLVSNSLVFFALYFAAVVALHRGLDPIQQATRLIGDLLPWRAAAHPASVGPPGVGTGEVRT